MSILPVFLYWYSQQIKLFLRTTTETKKYAKKKKHKCIFYRYKYSWRHSIINHCDRRITLFSDTDISYTEQKVYP